MDQSSSWYFEWLVHWGIRRGTKHAYIKKLFCSSIPPLELLVLSDGDPWNSSIARVGTPWCGVGQWWWTVIHDNMASPLCPTLSNPKRKIENVITDEIGVSDIFPKCIVLKSREDLTPLTKLSPFVIEKCIKSCAGEVKNVTKLRSGGLMIECQRQQSVRLLSLKQIHNIEISSSPHIILNSSRGIIRYRDDDLSELTDDEICHELSPKGVTHVKRFTSTRNGQVIKLNTLLYYFHLYLVPFAWAFTALESVQMFHIQYDALSVRSLDISKANAKGN